jgi:hypothetical protein
MKLYIGNLNHVVNCDTIIAELHNQQVTPCHGHMKLPVDNPYYNDYVNQTEMLKAVGYDDTAVEYRHYQCGTHFSQEIATTIGNIVDAEPLMCWISEIRPGKCTPWHWDINPWEKEHEQLGELVRYFCFLSKPAAGHIFVTAEDAYYMEEQGAIYQYAHIHDWHAGTNIGVAPKFLLTFTGYKKV